MSYSRPMTLRECMEAEEIQGEPVQTIQDIKLRCLTLAKGMSCSAAPSELITNAKELYDWVMDNTGNENQQ